MGSENGWNSNGENRWSREIATHFFHQRHSANAFYVVIFQTGNVFYVLIFRPLRYSMYSFSDRKLILCSHFHTADVFYVLIFRPQTYFIHSFSDLKTYFMY